MTVYQSPMSVDVLCVVCGRKLRGQPCVMPGRYLVRPHYMERRHLRSPEAGAHRVAGTDCPGSRRLDHSPLAQRNGALLHTA